MSTSAVAKRQRRKRSQKMVREVSAPDQIAHAKAPRHPCEKSPPFLQAPARQSLELANDGESSELLDDRPESGVMLAAQECEWSVAGEREAHENHRHDHNHERRHYAQKRYREARRPAAKGKPIDHEQPRRRKKATSASCPLVNGTVRSFWMRLEMKSPTRSCCSLSESASRR